MIGATIDSLDEVDRKTAKLIRRALAADEVVSLWAKGLEDQVVALTDRHVFIVKRGARAGAGAPLRAMVSTLDYDTILGAEVILGVGTGMFEISAAGMPGVDAWSWGGRLRRSRAPDLPNAFAIAQSQADEFQQVVEAIQARIR
ncbi:MAG TPA: hypothetical protein VIG86_05090 [Candidatus Dormibacteraeota bacterium]